MAHRISDEERSDFERAKGKGYLTVMGSGTNRGRGDSPINNTWRLWCDGNSVVKIVHEKKADGMDSVVVDVSPLRFGEEGGLEAAKAIEERFGRGVEEEVPALSIGGEDEQEDSAPVDVAGSLEAWATQPIHRLPPTTVRWNSLPRADARVRAAELAAELETARKGAGESVKARGVKAGKGRRSGGKGIGGG